MWPHWNKCRADLFIPFKALAGNPSTAVLDAEYLILSAIASEKDKKQFQGKASFTDFQTPLSLPIRDDLEDAVELLAICSRFLFQDQSLSAHPFEV